MADSETELSLAFLGNPLAPPQEDTLDVDDPRLEAIFGKVVKGEYRDAAVLAQRLWADRYYDVRVLGAYLFGAFLDQGLIAIPHLFQSVIYILEQHWVVISPSKKKVELTDKGLHWLFKNTQSEQ